MQIIVHSAIGHIANFYNKIEHYWESDKNHRLMGSFIVFTFLLSVLLIHLNRMGLIHSWLSVYIPTKYFSAIVYAFMVLLVFEILSMIFVLPRSVSSSMLKQFEIFSLILLRDVFKSMESFSEPVSQQNISDSIIPMTLDAGSALFIFIGIYYIRRMQLHKKITPDKVKLNQFVEIKKILSLILIFIFTGLIGYDIYLFFIQAPVFKMLTLFYTILIFFDILIVLVSLRYNLAYSVLFRNSAFAIATIMLRFSLTASVYYKTLLGVSSILFVLILTFFYSKYMKMIHGLNKEKQINQ